MFKMMFAIMIIGLSTSWVWADDSVPPIITEKCVKCHYVESHGIKTTKKDPKKAHDLSNAGDVITTAEEMRTYLKKESLRNDKKHKTSFKGSDEDFEKLIQWLLERKK